MTLLTHTVADVQRIVQQFWPEEHAEAWDRVGLVTGSPTAPVRKILLAVDVVADTVAQACQSGADLLLTHHPLLLRGVHTIAEDTAKGALLTQLLRNDCAAIAAHTNADCTRDGVSAVLAAELGVDASEPIVPGVLPGTGLGRVGTLQAPVTLRAFAARVAQVLPHTVSGVRAAGDPDRLVSKIALLGGAGDSLLDHPAVRTADVYVTSDLRHHPAQEALELSRVSAGPALIDVSHWASESLWLRQAAKQLSAALPGVECVVSELRTEPWTFAL